MKAHPFVCMTALLLSAGMVLAQDFVPFAIPAEPNLRSPIAVTSLSPIDVNSERLAVRDGHFWRSGDRVRLWGVNLAFSANFPTHADAVKVAARMAAAGVNTVRCHHMDTSNWPNGIWDADDPKKISTEALDRLDFFIHELARRGIFVNLNLHVGRSHSQYLGMPKSGTDYDKIVGIFTPRLIEAQRQYAKDLLDRRNRYRGNARYADDPAIALVEISNEDSFFMWSGDQDLRALPDFYGKVLQGQFNTWLKAKYGTTPALAAAWNRDTQPLGTNLLNNSTLLSLAKGWNLEQHDTAKAQLQGTTYQDQEGLRVQVLAKDNTDWHLQLNQGKVAVKAGTYYTVSFQAAADQPRSIGCNVGQAHDPWRGLGLSRKVDLTQQWKTFKLGFVAAEDDTDARVSFSFGNDSTTFYLANVEIRAGGQVGLAAGEALDASTVALFQENESQTRILDRMVFLAETEKVYFEGMRGYVRDTLGCKALVTGTIVFGPLGLYSQSGMDFIDGHAYWQHPSFPGRPWDSGNWLIEQIAMADRPQEATLFALAAQRLAGKPYTVTEYNHPAPSDSQVECVPLIASFGAAQGWDGIWLYTYSHSNGQWDRQVLSSYFDVDTNPAKWGFMRAGAAIFRDAAIGLAGHAAAIGLAEPGQDVVQTLAAAHQKHGSDLFAALSSVYSTGRSNLLEVQFAAALAGKPTIRPVMDTSTSMVWFVEADKGLFACTDKGAAVIVGHAQHFPLAAKGTVTVQGPEYLAVTVTPLDAKALTESTKVLITACGRCENTDMVFSQDRRTVGRNWGKAPVRIEAATARVRLPAGEWHCQALAPDGSPQAVVPIDPNGPSLSLSPSHKTLWYLLTR